MSTAPMPATPLRDHLDELDPRLGALYGRAVKAFAETPLAWDAVCTGAHSMRELTSNLPEALGDVEDMPPRSARSQSSRAEAKLVKAWSNGDVPNVSASEPSDQLVPVRADIVRAAGAFVDSVNAGTGNARRRNAVVALGMVSESDVPPLREFHAAVKYFQSKAHLPDPGVPVPPVSEIQQHLEVIETVLLARVGSFFEIGRDLEELAEKANEPVKGGSGQDV